MKYLYSFYISPTLRVTDMKFISVLADKELPISDYKEGKPEEFLKKHIANYEPMYFQNSWDVESWGDKSSDVKESVLIGRENRVIIFK